MNSIFISWARRSSAALSRPVIHPVRKPGRLRQSEPLAIVRVKGLDFECGAVGLRKQRNAAIRHSAVDVHEEQFDLRSAFLLAKPDKEASVKGKP